MGLNAASRSLCAYMFSVVSCCELLQGCCYTYAGIAAVAEVAVDIYIYLCFLLQFVYDGVVVAVRAGCIQQRLSSTTVLQAGYTV
jgi:hypothetical protein